VNITNLHPISHRFQDIAEYWSNFRCRQWVPLSAGTRSGWSLEYRIVRLSTERYCCMVRYKACLIGLAWTVRVTHECDGQTDGQTFSLNYVARPKCSHINSPGFARSPRIGRWELMWITLLISVRPVASNVLVSRPYSKTERTGRSVMIRTLDLA